MEYELVKLDNFSGRKASAYSIFLSQVGETLFEKFVKETKDSFKSELLDIIKRLNSIKDIGANEYFFKANEGNLGDGVVALYDTPNSNLRLYCIRYGSSLIIVGGGGPKPKSIRALQEDSKLTEENYLLRDISSQIQQRIKEKEIRFSNDGKDFNGDLTFNNEDYD